MSDELWKTTLPRLDGGRSVVHVLPINDAEPHEMRRWCPCRPDLEEVDGYGALVVVHRAWDGRAQQHPPTVH